MRKTRLLLFFFIFFFCENIAFATGDSTNYLTLKDTIFLTVGPSNEKIFEHQIERHQTLYSLAKFYGLSVEELYFYNLGLKDNNVQVGQRIRIPIPNRAILRYKFENFDPGRYIPVYYVVRRGDTLFRISKYFFRMPIDTVMARNHLVSEVLSPGQCLHVGWMNIGGIPEAFHQYTVDPLARRNFAMRKIYNRTIPDGEPLVQQGAAFWKKDSQADSDFYALHRYAATNSIIAVTNPMTNRTVYVKVIGNIPDRSYDNDVVVVLSPLSARALGAKDPRFFVRVTYHK